MEQRHHRTPFTFERAVMGWRVKASDGSTVALATQEGYAAFIVMACNQYDDLVRAFNLCRGHLNGLSQKRTTPGLQELGELFDRLNRIIDSSGR